MATAAIFCNGAIFAITGLVILTRGLSSRLPYVVLALLMLFVPLFTATVLVLRKRAAGPAESRGMTRGERATIALNLAQFAAAASSAIAQYPYAPGGTLLPFAVLAVGTPVLNVAAVLAGVRRSSPRAGGSTADSL
jgi:hypothetical protein